MALPPSSPWLPPSCDRERNGSRIRFFARWPEAGSTFTVLGSRRVLAKLASGIGVRFCRQEPVREKGFRGYQKCRQAFSANRARDHAGRHKGRKRQGNGQGRECGCEAVLTGDESTLGRVKIAEAGPVAEIVAAALAPNHRRHAGIAWWPGLLGRVGYLRLPSGHFHLADRNREISHAASRLRPSRTHQGGGRLPLVSRQLAVRGRAPWKLSASASCQRPNSTRYWRNSRELDAHDLCDPY